MRLLPLALAILLAFPVIVIAADAPPADAASTVVLDTSGFWRMHHTLAMPVIRREAGLEPIPPAGSDATEWAAIVKEPTAPPPDGWMAAGFDDADWLRAPAAGSCHSPYVARASFRARFTVPDPAAATALQLSVDYHGGLIVYLNGTEIARRHLPAGPLAADSLAEDYPLEAYVDADGKLISQRGESYRLSPQPLPEETLRRIALRTRTLQIPLPPAHLKPGENIIALQLVRSAYHGVLDTLKGKQAYKSGAPVHDLAWNSCDLRRIQLTAPSDSGIASEAVRPSAPQVWNSDPMATDFDLDFAGPSEPLRPIRLVAARGGAFSGKVVVGSSTPLRGLKATAADLASGPNRIPAASLRIRYAIPWDVCRTSTESNVDAMAYPAKPEPLYALLEEPLEEFPVRSREPLDPQRRLPSPVNVARYALEVFPLETPGQPQPVFGAVVPVWVTVNVPRDAAPGLYRGTLNVELDGKPLAQVPLEVNVTRWTVPETADYDTFVDLVQSPDVLALEYGVELWSDRHWQLIGNSLSYLKEVGNRTLYVPLIAHTNLGNAESMVRWVRKADGSYDYDFSILEKYIDLAVEKMGRPEVICLNVWDLYLYREGGKAYAYVGGQTAKKAEELVNNGPLVTVVDSASGERSTVALPPESDPASAALWKPLFAALRQKMKDRGLENALMLGMITDAWCSKEQVQFWQSVGADLPWVSASHGRHPAAKSLYGIADIGFQAHAFGCNFGYTRSLRGWNLPHPSTCYERWGEFPVTMLTRWRHFPEYSVTGNQSGIGRIGADYWRAVRDRSGQREGFAWSRYPESGWRQLSLVTSTLAPGPDGAVATARFEALRHGLQDTEARIQIERALADPAAVEKLGQPLIDQANQILAERHRAMWLSFSTLQVGTDSRHAFAGWRGCYFAGVTGYRWYLGSQWQQRTAALYNLAAEIGEKMAAAK